MPRAMSRGKEGAPLPLVSGEGFRVTATSSGRPSSDMRPPEPGRRAARRLFILRYLKRAKAGGGFSAGEVKLKCLNRTSSLTSPVLPENEQRCSWRREDNLPSASCRDTCTFCTCCVEEAAERHQVRSKATSNQSSCFPRGVLTHLLRVGSFLAVVLNEVHQAVHHRLHCYQPFLQLFPSGRGSIWNGGQS